MENIELEVNGRQLSFIRINAFDTHQLIQKLVKTLGPIAKDFNLQADVSNLIHAIASLPDDIIESLVLPTFKKANLLVDGKRLQTLQDVNVVFQAEDIMDLYEIAFHVIKALVGDAFTKALTRFGAAI